MTYRGDYIAPERVSDLVSASLVGDLPDAKADKRHVLCLVSVSHLPSAH